MCTIDLGCVPDDVISDPDAVHAVTSPHTSHDVITNWYKIISKS